MHQLSKVQIVSESQVAFGGRLGLDLRGLSVGVALAKIEDAISIAFGSNSDLGTPSTKQCDLAKKFGFDISNESKGVGAAIIEDIMYQLNQEAIDHHCLAPGVQVRHKNYESPEPLVISSIKSDGTVFFKGGNGKKAWARSLERIS